MIDRTFPQDTSQLPADKVATSTSSGRSQTTTTTKIHYFTVLNTIVAMISLISMLQSYKVLRKVRRVKKLEKYGHDSEQLPKILLKYVKRSNYVTGFTGIVFLLTVQVTSNIPMNTKFYSLIYHLCFESLRQGVIFLSMLIQND